MALSFTRDGYALTCCKQNVWKYATIEVTVVCQVLRYENVMEIYHVDTRDEMCPYITSLICWMKYVTNSTKELIKYE